MAKSFDPIKHQRRIGRLCQRIRDALYFRRSKERAQLLARVLERMDRRAPASQRLVIGEWTA